MGQATTYLIMMSGIMLLFYFGGLLTVCTDDGLCESHTPNGKLLDLVLRPERMQSSEWWSTLKFALGALATAVGAIVLASYYYKFEIGVKTAVTIYLFDLGWDFIAVFNVVRATNPILALLIFSPLAIVYVTTMIEWWTGRD